MDKYKDGEQANWNKVRMPVLILINRTTQAFPPKQTIWIKLISGIGTHTYSEVLNAIRGEIDDIPRN